MYGDFFDPPKGDLERPKKGKKMEKGKKGKGVKFQEEPKEEVDTGRGVMDRVKTDLFDSDDEGETDVKSTHDFYTPGY